MSEKTKIADNEIPFWEAGKLHESAFTLAKRLNSNPWICNICGSAEIHTVKTGNVCVCGSRAIHRRRVFSLSLSDWLDPEVPIEWMARMLRTLRSCKQVTWILCTKRPELWRQQLGEALKYVGDLPDALIMDTEDNALWWYIHGWLDCDHPPKNVTLLTSVENQAMADKRIPELLKIPAVCHGLSCEPLLGPVDLSRFYGYTVPNENKLHRREGNTKSYCGGEIQGGPTGDNLARGCEGRASDAARVFAGAADGERSEALHGSAQDSVSGASGHDTSRINNQPQERQEGRQPAGKLGDCHIQPASNSLAQHTGEKSEGAEPAWAEELQFKVDGQPSAINPGGICRIEQRDPINASGEIRDSISDGFKNRARGQVEISGRIGGELYSTQKPRISWQIIGGESGPGARPCNVEWIRSLVKQGAAAGVPTFVKQMGSNPHFDLDATKLYFKDKKGSDPLEWHLDLRVQEFPDLEKP